MSYGQDTIFHADFENTSGDNNWSLSTNASDGNWVIGTPNPYTTGGNQMEIGALGGNGTLQTGINNNQDLDGGPVNAQSPDINIPIGTTNLNLGQYFSHYQNSSSSDFYRIELRDATNDTVLDTILFITGNPTNRAAQWQTINYDLTSLAGQSIYIYLESADISNGSKVEAALDEVVITNDGNSVSCTQLIFDDFEGGAGNWIDGGSDASRINNSSFASSGNFSFRLRDNTSTSVITTNTYDISGVDSVKVSFNAHPFSLEGAEDLWFQISNDNGATYTTLETWANGAEFTNDVPQFIQFSIAAPFTSMTRFRFRLDASGNADYVYLDDILIETCNVTPLACPIVSLQDTFVCNLQMITVNGNPSGGSGTYTNHFWSDLGSGTASGYVLSNTNQESINIDLNASTSGSVSLTYSVTDSSGCSVTDTMQVVITSTPLCEIETETDTICTGVTATLRTVNQYAVTPFEGMVISANSGPGLTQDHTIIGVQDPAHTKLVITLPTWDDHFDSTFLNGELILPEIFETESYDSDGMNCLTPWVANTNGLPRSIIEIKSGSVRYFSSLTPSSTVMTEVFPTNWSTIPRNIIEGDNILRFGVQNTAGPVSGSWIVEAFGNEGYTYLWNTGATADSITISPATSETYSVTVTSPNGCTSTCSYDIVVQNIDIATDDVFLCPNSQVDISSNINLAIEPINHLWGPTDTLLTGIVLSGTTSDTLSIAADGMSSGVMSLYHYVQDAKGCERTDTFQLTVTPEVRDSIYAELCDGIAYQFGDTTITESGFYEKTDLSQLGCDSITVLEVLFLPAIMDTIGYIGCEGDGFSISINGNTYDETQPSGTETLSTGEGCDSIIYIDLFYEDSIITNINYSGCSDDGYSIVVNGTVYDFNNPNGIESITTASGCDSTIIVNLSYDIAAIVNAGMPSNAICSNSVVTLLTLGASITGGTTSGTWTTTGDGFFDNSGDFETATTYTPGPLDIAYGEIILNLTSANPPGSCEPEADAAMILINDISCSQFPWAGN